MGAAIPSHADRVVGVAQGLAAVDYVIPNGTVPLLSEFSLASREGADHHLSGLGVLPDDELGRGEIVLFFRDDSFQTRFTYEARHANARFISPDDLRDREVVCEGTCVVRIEDPPTETHLFVLVGIFLQSREELPNGGFNNGVDHHIDRIEVTEKDRLLRVAYRDKTGDDQFSATIRYAWVSRAAFVGIGANGGSRARGSATVSTASATEGVPVVRGFAFDFEPDCTSGDDHHIRQVGITHEQDAYTLSYADKSGDDCFDYELYWAKIDPSRLVVPEPDDPPPPPEVDCTSACRDDHQTCLDDPTTHPSVCVALENACLAQC